MNEDKIKEVANELCKSNLVQDGQSFTYKQLHKTIADKMNRLLAENFSLVISILYRLDISEKKLKMQLSKSENAPAGDIIATMIIERQLQKIETRKIFRFNNFSEEEKW